MFAQSCVSPRDKAGGKGCLCKTNVDHAIGMNQWLGGHQLGRVNKAENNAVSAKEPAHRGGWSNETPGAIFKNTISNRRVDAVCI